MILSILTWWLIIQALGLAGLPLAGLLFRALPDRGYPFAKSLGLLLSGYLAWLLAMLGLAPFGAPLLIGSALAVAAIGWWLQRSVRVVTIEDLRARWPTILAYELIFLGALAAMALFRSVNLDFFAPNPNPWFTERPMDFAFFNSIRSGGSFPPSDPWLAGHSINYYYFGYLLMASMALLSGVAPGAAYNLSLALIFALTALGIAGVIVNLIGLVRRDKGTGGQGDRRQETEDGGIGSLGRWVAALLGIVLVLVAGNQSGAIQVIVGSERAVALDGRQLITAISQSIGGAAQINLPYPVPTGAGDFGSFSSWERQDKATDFNWWWPSRSLWDEYNLAAPGQPAQPERRYTITEFPFFSFWLGDMHPHVMSLPFGLLAIALALSLIARPAAPALARSRGGWAELILSGVILGSLYAINSWDLPTYLLLYAGALTLLYRRLAGSGPLLWRELLSRLLLVAIASFLLFAPFHLTFRSLVGRAQPWLDLPIIGRLTSIIAPYMAGRSGLHSFIIIFGLFAVPLAAFVYLAQQQTGDRRQETGDKRQETGDEQEKQNEPVAAPLGLTARSSSFILHPSSFIPWLPPALLLIGLLVGFPLLALLGLGLLALVVAWRSPACPAESFALLVVALGCAVLFGTDLIYIRDVFEGSSSRMNTIFKFYYQIWLIWGTLAPFALWWILSRTAGLRRIVGVGSAALFALLLIGALVYPTINLRRLDQGELAGLDGHTPREQSAAGLASIIWLRGNAAPGSTVLEAADVLNAADVAAIGVMPACGGSYNGEGYGGVSAATGLPTVLGWSGHEDQWRGGDPTVRDELPVRCADIDTIYRSRDAVQARSLLDKYAVDYIYVGGLERSDYSPESLAKFDALGEAVFQQDEVTIYRLRREIVTPQ